MSTSPEHEGLLDPEKVDEVRGWLIKAAEDLLMAERGAHGSPQVLSGAVFHAQQAAEKALKAYLAWHDTPFRQTLDLVGLAAQCAAIDGSFAALRNAAEALTPYAVRFRYPQVPLSPTTEQTDGALAMARDIVAFVRARLPAEVQPGM